MVGGKDQIRLAFAFWFFNLLALSFQRVASPLQASVSALAKGGITADFANLLCV